MKSIDQIPDNLRQSLRGIFSDIADTITTHGMLSAEAHSAIENISERGIDFIPITGRPAGWCDMIARFWPVKGVIGENGAFFFSYDHEKKKMIRRYIQNEKEILEGRKKLEKIKQKILEEVAGCAVSSDQFSRASDLAIGFCEDVHDLPIAAVKKIAKMSVPTGYTSHLLSCKVTA